MPKLKQPSSLEATAMKVLVEFTVRYCDQLTTESTLHMLREGISVIKEDVCDRIPWCSLPEFCTTFLEKFSQKSRPKRHLQAASEILLDVEFVGLRCNGKILRHLNPQHVHRLRGLVELDLGSEEKLPIILENYLLNGLTTLILPTDCSDHDLTVISRNCSKLRVIKLECSNITDEGLRALSSCSELRVVHISDCYKVTHIRVNFLISAHDKLEELSFSNPRDIYCTQPDGFLFLSSLNRPCLVMKRLVIGTKALVTNANLRSIVSTFTNLIHFGTICKSVETLSILKSLSKLEEISLYFSTYYDEGRAWESLKELLTFVGVNIKTLRFGKLGRGGIIQISEETGLDFIFHNCPNIEYLEFDHGKYDLVLPPFKKLKTLKLKTDKNMYPRYLIKLLKIGRMVNLEVLSILNFKVRFPTIKGIVLNNVKFPKLIRIEGCHVSKIEEIKAIARKRNLDFKEVV